MLLGLSALGYNPIACDLVIMTRKTQANDLMTSSPTTTNTQEVISHGQGQRRKRFHEPIRSIPDSVPSGQIWFQSGLQSTRPTRSFEEQVGIVGGSHQSLLFSFLHSFSEVIQ
jgi:hypothetical protein